MKKENPYVVANRKWRMKNPDHAKYLRYRTSARTFVRKWATEEDMQELNKIFEEEGKEQIYQK